jgi:hypothetical protein
MAKKPMVRIHDTFTNEIIDREMNEVEYDQYLLDVASQEKYDVYKATVESNKLAAIAKLEALGLTTDELKAVIGI